MNLRYMAKELHYQRRRTLMSILGLSIGIALLIILNSLSSAYRQAAMPSEIERHNRSAVRRCLKTWQERSFPVRQ
jgi:hypothetical protein